MDLIVKLIVGIAWPVAIVWIAYIFKSELKALVTRISHLKYKEVEAKFEKDLTEIEADLNKFESITPINIEHTKNLSQLEQLRRIAEISPRAAIMEAWMLVEISAIENGLTSGSTIQRVYPRSIIEHLIQSGKMPKESADAILKLRQLRNQAAHLPEFSLSYDEAERYLDLAVKASEIIGMVNEES